MKLMKKNIFYSIVDIFLELLTQVFNSCKNYSGLFCENTDELINQISVPINLILGAILVVVSNLPIVKSCFAKCFAKMMSKWSKQELTIHLHK